MVFSAPCSGCKHKDVECAITRERRKRGRRGRAERANAKQKHETLGVHDFSQAQEWAKQTETCSADESSPASSLIDTGDMDPTTRPNTPAMDIITPVDRLYLETPSSCSSTSSSQILEELGMGLTEEEYLPTAHLFHGFFDLSAGNDFTTPPLSDICAADDVTAHAPTDVPSDSSPLSSRTVDLSPDYESKPRPDYILYGAEGDHTIQPVDLLETTLYGNNMSMSWSPMTTRIGSELFC